MKRLAILSVTIILLIFSTKAQEIKDINEYLYTIDKSIPSYLTFADKGNIKKQRINIKDKGVALKKILKLNDETTETNQKIKKQIFRVVKNKYLCPHGIAEKQRRGGCRQQS